ncbi:DUF2382 domain-containing protein [Planktothrix mougeotii]|uniref:DUF2382 domain-containing protein n=1 Tax=Planktothrix mougeotii LEGE 06226 TaxID=1828728 RepID=A0ABR9UAX0_9CYAN|nr:DUF2382 domain-containing protein [Planktothrix mougeotii]MBE9143601.1 DUF2382 domain-containing protein [Planktothrix mougeotii LEGE 06226]
MTLFKIKDAYPHYKEEIFDGKDLKKFDVYTDTTNEKIGTVYDALIDENGYFRYFVIDTGFWVFGKKVLLPVGRAQMDYANQRVYALGLTKNQAEALPEYTDNMTVDYDYEERVRAGYRTSKSAKTNYNRDNYKYENEPELYLTQAQNHGTIKLYEERLIAEKQRQKAGTVSVGKTVEVRTEQASVPVEKERVVVERMTPTGERPVNPGEANFREGEVARVDVYEETADIRKQAFVTEEVNVRKEVDRDTVTAQEKLRREKLNVKTDGEPTIKDKR